MKYRAPLTKVGDRETPFRRREIRAWAKLNSRTESFNACCDAYSETAKAKQEAR